MPPAKLAKPNNENESKASSNWRQIAIGVAIGVLSGVILGAGSMFYSQGAQIAVLKEQINQLKTQNVNPGSNKPKDQPIQIKAKPNRLIEIIIEDQRIYVKESWGELANQNFTQKDLDEFKKKDIPKQVTDKLRHNGDFLEVVLAIKQMRLSEQQKLLDQALRTYKPTWEERGTISREGQTEAGQEAERMIAGAVVGLVKELSRLSPEDLRKLSSE
jgi:hypothetical protein